MHPIDKINIPFHTIHVDLMGNLTGTNKKAYVLVAIDAFTKFILLYPLKDKSTKMILNSFREMINIFGTPCRIISDRETAIMGTEIQDFFKSFFIEHHAIARGTPRANGQVERQMRTLKDHLTAISLTQSRVWVNKIGELQLALNCTKSKATGYSPLELLLGKRCSPPAIEQIALVNEDINKDEIRLDAKHRMVETAEKNKIRFDSKCAKIKPFLEGDFVLCKDTQWSGNKLGPKYLGPYQIIKVLDNHRYEVKDLRSLRNKNTVITHEHMRLVPNPNLTE